MRQEFSCATNWEQAAFQGEGVSNSTVDGPTMKSNGIAYCRAREELQAQEAQKAPRWERVDTRVGACTRMIEAEPL